MQPVNILRPFRRRRTDPAGYWERRAPELVSGYDHPETWAERGWMSSGVEEVLVPRLLQERRIGSVLVVGAGSGRQYAFVSQLGIEVRGFDISPTMVAAARKRHPEIETVVDDLLGAETRHEPADAVLATAVLQHVSPEHADEAARTVQALARRLIVLRELTWAAAQSDYQWAHDYGALFPGWEIVERAVTDETARGRVELRALVRATTD